MRVAWGCKGYFGRLTVGDKSIEIWGITEDELEKLINYYKENHSEFEEEWERQQRTLNVGK